MQYKALVLDGGVVSADVFIIGDGCCCCWNGGLAAGKKAELKEGNCNQRRKTAYAHALMLVEVAIADLSRLPF
jgi:hypothetical protein